MMILILEEDLKKCKVKDPKLYPDEYYVEVMDSMYLPLEASYNGLRTID
jgi:hypothetical protein